MFHVKQIVLSCENIIVGIKNVSRETSNEFVYKCFIMKK